MKKLVIETVLKGQVFDSFVKPSTHEKTNAKTNEIYPAQPEKYYLQFIGEKVLDKDSGENKKQFVDVKILSKDGIESFIDKEVEIKINIFQMGKDSYYNMVENSQIKIIK